MFTVKARLVLLAQHSRLIRTAKCAALQAQAVPSTYELVSRFANTDERVLLLLPLPGCLKRFSINKRFWIFHR
jgi:hypothetical protein